MTFEEYKTLAENPQFSDAPAIFKVEVYVIDSCGSKKYYRKTMSEPWKYSEIYCLTLEEAKQCLHNEMDRIGFEKYCAYIYQIPINKSTNFPYDRAWLYDHNGNLIDQSYCSYNIDKEEHFQFRGRPENAIRFKRGDIVELLNDYCDKSKFVIVYSTPPNIETAYKMNNRLKKYNCWLDSTIDSYIVVDQSFVIDEEKKYVIKGFTDGNPLRLIKPRFEPPRNVVRYLNQCLQKAIKEYDKIIF